LLPAHFRRKAQYGHVELQACSPPNPQTLPSQEPTSVLVAKLFHPADTVGLLICSYAGIPQSALDMSRRISLASKCIGLGLCFGRSPSTFVIRPIRSDSLSHQKHRCSPISRSCSEAVFPLLCIERGGRGACLDLTMVVRFSWCASRCWRNSCGR
jgi:hypothetical protein